MSEPLTLRWLNASRYHTATLAPDLFGDWVLVTTSGSKEDGGGRVRQQPLPTYEEGMEAIRRLRHRRRIEGYECRETSFTPLAELDGHSEPIRSAETQALLRLFQAWGVDAVEQAALLGVDDKTLGHLQDGCALSDESGLMTRSTHLLAINKVLRLRFDRDQAAMREWLRQPCKALSGETPLAMMQGPDESLATLRGYVSLASDRARGCSGAPR